MLKLYDYLDSGNGYKVRLLLSQLGRPFELIELDILRGETRTPEFLAINPNGRIPVLVLEDGRVLARRSRSWARAPGPERERSLNSAERRAAEPGLEMELHHPPRRAVGAARRRRLEEPSSGRE